MESRSLRDWGTSRKPTESREEVAPYMALAAFTACPANEGAKRLVVARFYEGRRGFVHGVYPQITILIEL